MKKNERGAIGAGLLVTLGVLAVLAVGALSFYGYAKSIRNEALDWETDLNAVVRVEVSERATYETSIVEQLGLARAKTAAIKDIVSAAMEGRYGDKPNEGNLLFKAVSEAYPGTEGTNIYDKLLPAIQSGREGIRNKQNLRIEKATKYDRWRKDGIFRAWVLSGIYPSNDLTFKVGDKTYRAVEALEKMAEPISTANVNRSFETGIEQPIDTGGK